MDDSVTEDEHAQHEVPAEERKPTPNGPIQANPTPAAAWREETNRVVELPSHRFVRIRRVNLLTLIEQGILPIWDDEEVRKALPEGKARKVDSKLVMDVVRRFHNPEHYVGFLKAVMVAGTVEPKMTLKPMDQAAEDEVPLELLTSAEQTVLMNAISKFSGFSEDLTEFSRPF